jgi:hypothetical protein
VGAILGADFGRRWLAGPRIRSSDTSQSLHEDLVDHCRDIRRDSVSTGIRVHGPGLATIAEP